MTQSIIIAAVEQGAESPDGVFRWLMRELDPLFTGAAGTFPFGGYVRYMQKVEGRGGESSQDAAA